MLCWTQLKKRVQRSMKMSHNPSLSEEIVVNKAKLARFEKNPCGRFLISIYSCAQCGLKICLSVLTHVFCYWMRMKFVGCFSSSDLASTVFDFHNDSRIITISSNPATNAPHAPYFHNPRISLFDHDIRNQYSKDEIIMHT